VSFVPDQQQVGYAGGTENYENYQQYQQRQQQTNSPAFWGWNF